RAATDETVGPGAGAFEGDLCAAAGEDRDWLLDRPGAKRQVLHIEEPALVRDVLLSPEALHQLHAFHCPAASPLERNFDRGEIVFPAAKTHAYGSPPIGNEIQCRHGLGEQR